MRILTITNLYPNPYQPHRATFNRDELRALAEEHAVAVIAPIAWTDELRARWKVGRLLPINRRVGCDGLDVHHPRYLYTPRVLRHCYGAFFRGSIRHAFNQALDQFRPEMVYAPWAYPDGWAAMHLAHQAGLPAIVKVHGSDVRLLDSYPDRLKRTAEVCRGADGIVAVSEDLARRVIALEANPDRVRTIYGAVDTRRFHPAPRTEALARLDLPADRPVILFVGNLLSVKGVDVLIEACQYLNAMGRRFTCRLVGEGPLRPHLERQIARRGLQDTVRLEGVRPHQQLPDWYRAASLFVLPSRSEGVPTVLLEAAACGTPFVATRVGGIPEIAHLGVSRLVPPEDAAALTRAVAAALDDPCAQRSSAPAHVRGLRELADDLTDFFRERLRPEKHSVGQALDVAVAKR